MPVQEICQRAQDCLQTSEEKCIAQSLHFIHDIFQGVSLDDFCVTIFLSTGEFYRPNADLGLQSVSGYGNSLRATCQDAETKALNKMKRMPALDADASGYGTMVACKLHLKGTYFTGDPNDFLCKHDALSKMRKFCPMEESEHVFFYGKNVSMSLFEQPAAQVLCDDVIYFDDLGSLFHQTYPVFKKHVQRVVQREIHRMLDLIFA